MKKILTHFHLFAVAVFIVMHLTAVTSYSQDSSKITVNVGGFLQVQYHDSFKDESISSFRVLRAHLSWYGKFTDDWFYWVQIDAADQNKNHLRDAIIRWKKYDYFQITVGQSFIPFSIVNEIPTYKTYFIDTEEPYLFLSSTREVGIRIDGALNEKQFNYSFGLFNGNGINKNDDNNNKDFIGKFSVYPFKGLFGKEFDELRFMVGYHKSKYDEQDSIGVDRNRYVFSADYIYKGFRLFGEYFYQEKKSINYLESNGWYVTATYRMDAFILPLEVEPVFRYEEYVPSILNKIIKYNVATLGINCYLNNYFTLYVNYRMNSMPNNSTISDYNEVNLKLQVHYGLD